MRQAIVIFNIFEKGDRVCTPFGNGVILKDEVLSKTFANYGSRTVFVTLDDPDFDDDDGVEEMDGWLPSIET